MSKHFTQERTFLSKTTQKSIIPFIIIKATALIKLKPIADIIAATYTGLFVDEYQDCTDSQHKLIVALSEILPTRLLGDPLQGIFGFHSEALVDFNSSIGMVEFNNEKHLLEEPWRWKHTNVNLGKDLKEIRKKLEERKVVQLKEYKSIEVIIVNEKELLVPKKIIIKQSGNYYLKEAY
ncbi:MAG: UvrD-helicase domain-containing protein [Segetibacter sp.]